MGEVDNATLYYQAAIPPNQDNVWSLITMFWEVDGKMAKTTH